MNQMLQASIVFTLRWVGIRDGREFEQSSQMWGKFYFLIWILVQFWKLTMLHTLDLCSLLCVLLITNGYIKVVCRVLGWGQRLSSEIQRLPGQHTALKTVQMSRLSADMFLRPYSLPCMHGFVQGPCLCSQRQLCLHFHPYTRHPTMQISYLSVLSTCPA